VARVEAGYPEWGLDVDDSTIPQEANLDALGAISYTKGCYTGQEVVARIHFRGHVNRHLRGLAFALDDGAEAAERAAPIPAGAALVDEHDKPVGDVRTSARSPRLGGVALGMVRREVPVGAALRARWPERDGGAVRERPVTVTVLPFPR
jgi:folate-binding protein YgfZ